MSKTLTALSVSIVAAAATAGGIAAASPHAARAAAAATDLRTTAKLTSAHRIDLPPHGPSAGDITIFGGRLLGPDLTGSYHAYCVSVSRAQQECAMTLAVPGGQIAAQAFYGQSSTALTPIVGGSGKYSGTRGDMSERETQRGREDHLVLHLQQ